MEGEESGNRPSPAEGTAERKRGTDGDGTSPEDRRAADDRPADVREAHRKICALFDACRDDGSARGIRDAALLSVLYGAGVPRATALALPLGAYDADRAVLTWPVGGRQGDDGAEDEVRARRATDGARAALEDWLEVRGSAPGALLCRLAGGSGTGRALAEEAVSSILRRWARSSGMETPDEAERIRLYTSPWWEDAKGEATPG